MKTILKTMGMVLVLLLAGSTTLNAQRGMRGGRQDSAMMHRHGMEMQSMRDMGPGHMYAMHQGPGSRYRGDFGPGRFEDRGFRPQGPGMRRLESIPDLTEKQKKDIEELRQKQFEEMTKFREENSAKMQSMREEHRKKVLNLLTDEQKKYLDVNSGTTAAPKK